MQGKDRIIELFEKLLQDQATEKDKKELFYLVNHGKNKSAVFDWLKKNWEEIEYDHISLSSKSLLEKIHGQINEKETYIEKKENTINLRRIIVTTLKYAAVCLIALSIQWFVFNHSKGEDKEQLVQSTMYHEISVPEGSKSFILLADSTKVWLNAGAKFRYPSNFQKESREVFLEGEAFFDVSKNKNMPFFVHAEGMNIKVLGTKFNVKAYANDKSIEATLLEGAIEVIGLKSDKENEQNLMLKPGQKIILSRDQESYQLTTNSSPGDNNKERNTVTEHPVKIKQAEVITLVDLEPEISWKEDKLIFHNERFEDVSIKLERWYGVTIEVKNPEILDYRITGTFDKETFEQAMEAFREAANFNYNIKKKHVIIKKNKN